MKNSILLCLIFSFLSFGCKKEKTKKTDSDELAQFCSYQKQGNSTFTNDCESDLFIKRLSSSGIISYDSTLNNYIISKHIEGTIDCVIITVFCEEYENFKGLENKQINYSADYYEYTGSFNPPLGGMGIFVAKNVEYSVKK